MNVVRISSRLLSLPEEANTLILIAFINKRDCICTFLKNGLEQGKFAGQSAVWLRVSQVKTATPQLLLPILSSETTAPPHLSAQLLV